MLTELCPKHWVARAVCGCLALALAMPSIASMSHGDEKAKLVPVQQLTGAPGFGTSTGTAPTVYTFVADTTIPNQRYTLFWPTQARKAPVDPTGPGGGDRLKVATVYTGPFGHPTGPTGGAPPSSGP
jgi:hypothetical protein